MRQVADGRSDPEGERLRCDQRDTSGSCHGAFAAVRRHQTDDSTRPAASWFPGEICRVKLRSCWWVHWGWAAAAPMMNLTDLPVDPSRMDPSRWKPADPLKKLTDLPAVPSRIEIGSSVE